MTEAAALEGTPYALLPATTAACAALQLIDASITPHIIMPTGIVAPQPALTISPAGTIHATPQTTSSLPPAAPTMQHRILSPGR